MEVLLMLGVIYSFDEWIRTFFVLWYNFCLLCHFYKSAGKNTLKKTKHSPLLIKTLKQHMVFYLCSFNFLTMQDEYLLLVSTRLFKHLSCKFYLYLAYNYNLFHLRTCLHELSQNDGAHSLLMRQINFTQTDFFFLHKHIFSVSNKSAAPLSLEMFFNSLSSMLLPLPLSNRDSPPN